MHKKVTKKGKSIQVPHHHHKNLQKKNITNIGERENAKKVILSNLTPTLLQLSSMAIISFMFAMTSDILP
jgi:hypothetical protein